MGKKRSSAGTIVKNIKKTFAGSNRKAKRQFNIDHKRATRVNKL